MMAEKRYLIALPIASLDRRGAGLSADRVRAWPDPETALVLGFASDSFLVEDEA